MTEILEIFSLLLNTDKFQKCQTDNKKSSKSFSDLLLSLAADGRWIFSFESSGQVGPMMDSTINSCFPFKALCIFSISLDDYFFHNQSMYL